MKQTTKEIKIETSKETGVGLGIILSGKSHVGKDAIANELIKNYGFKKYAFADLLKEYCSDKYDYQLDWNYSQKGKQRIVEGSGGRSVRDILIYEGRKGREEDSLKWVKNIVTKIMTDKPPFYVITDCRFKNEADVFKYFNGVIVRINASDEDRIKWGCPQNMVNSSDSTETDLDNYEGFNLEYDIEYGCRNDLLAKEIVHSIYEKEL